MRTIPCVVCRKRRASMLLCDPCGRSYDRDLKRNMTLAGAIEWAAKRARRFALQKEKT